MTKIKCTAKKIRPLLYYPKGKTYYLTSKGWVRIPKIKFTKVSKKQIEKSCKKIEKAMRIIERPKTIEVPKGMRKGQFIENLLSFMIMKRTVPVFYLKDSEFDKLLAQYLKTLKPKER